VLATLVTPATHSAASALPRDAMDVTTSLLAQLVRAYVFHIAFGYSLAKCHHPSLPFVTLTAERRKSRQTVVTTRLSSLRAVRCRGDQPCEMHAQPGSLKPLGALVRPVELPSGPTHFSALTDPLVSQRLVLNPHLVLLNAAELIALTRSRHSQVQCTHTLSETEPRRQATHV
jgi:hypothetical protein